MLDLGSLGMFHKLAHPPKANPKFRLQNGCPPFNTENRSFTDGATFSVTPPVKEQVSRAHS